MARYVLFVPVGARIPYTPGPTAPATAGSPECTPPTFFQDVRARRGGSLKLPEFRSSGFGGIRRRRWRRAAANNKAGPAGVRRQPHARGFGGHNSRHPPPRGPPGTSVRIGGPTGDPELLRGVGGPRVAFAHFPGERDRATPAPGSGFERAKLAGGPPRPPSIEVAGGAGCLRRGRSVSLHGIGGPNGPLRGGELPGARGRGFLRGKTESGGSSGIGVPARRPPPGPGARPFTANALRRARAMARDAPTGVPVRQPTPARLAPAEASNNGASASVRSARAIDPPNLPDGLSLLALGGFLRRGEDGGRGKKT